MRSIRFLSTPSPTLPSLRDVELFLSICHFSVWLPYFVHCDVPEYFPKLETESQTDIFQEALKGLPFYLMDLLQLLALKGVSMTTATEKKTCAHPPCQCEAEAGMEFCSDSCRSPEPSKQNQCECEHSKCGES